MKPYQNILSKQREFYNTGKTLDVKFRIAALKKLEQALKQYEDQIVEALHADFNKSAFETLVTELVMLRFELRKNIKNVKSWTKPNRVLPSLLNFPSTDKIYKQPYGVCLVISPWNYPVLLTFQPIIAAIAAGNTVILKPSELVPHTSDCVEQILNSCFDAHYVAVIQGGVEATTDLLKLRYDKIFFTGSTAVGKIVQQAAAPFLTPTVLELGGKSPCVITANANLKLAAKRIVFGKYVNAGQTCIAPDFLWIHQSVKAAFLKELSEAITAAYGVDIQSSPDFPRIVNAKNFERLKNYIQPAKVVFGGQSDAADRYIAPTVMDDITFDDPVMQDEIFGPILPVMTYTDLSEIVQHNQQTEKPLAFYMFSNTAQEIEYLMENTQFGGGSVNDCLAHIINGNLPFGGVGASGMGSYHGKFGFDAFTHQKAVVKRSRFIDIPLKYAPYNNKKNLIKKILTWI
ncbi:MAG: aldehyde dehydrogenase [Flavobacterium sp.]|nr:aldehyde dehydrogenase [Candidatus Neoflavobacterium equi]